MENFRIIDLFIDHVPKYGNKVVLLLRINKNKTVYELGTNQV